MVDFGAEYILKGSHGSLEILRCHFGNHWTNQSYLRCSPVKFVITIVCFYPITNLTFVTVQFHFYI